MSALSYKHFVLQLATPRRLLQQQSIRPLSGPNMKKFEEKISGATSEIF